MVVQSLAEPVIGLGLSTGDLSRTPQPVQIDLLRGLQHQVAQINGRIGLVLPGICSLSLRGSAVVLDEAHGGDHYRLAGGQLAQHGDVEQARPEETLKVVEPHDTAVSALPLGGHRCQCVVQRMLAGRLQEPVVREQATHGFDGRAGLSRGGVPLENDQTTPRIGVQQCSGDAGIGVPLDVGSEGLMRVSGTVDAEQDRVGVTDTAAGRHGGRGATGILPRFTPSPGEPGPPLLTLWCRQRSTG